MAWSTVSTIGLRFLDLEGEGELLELGIHPAAGKACPYRKTRKWCGAAGIGLPIFPGKKTLGMAGMAGTSPELCIIYE